MAVGGDLSTERLLLAYRHGIFPWYSDGQPILWWSPDPRMVLFPEEFKTSKSLARTIRRSLYRVTFDLAFGRVISACASTRMRKEKEAGTWITSEMQEAYSRLHLLGYAHSVEAWHREQLVGGLYGVSLGGVFFGESMFSMMNDASKVCLAALVEFAIKHSVTMIDCQVATKHLSSMGAREIPRKEFVAQLNRSIKHPTLTGIWSSPL